ncbi:solute carrier family 22 member 4-like [Mercenaria mercenaria]|uniref:solute carrier family 22 member 4-like n=1 Tax=Mercenaria mercenaria TaxID=6596 RepID=UPI00234F4D6A|nr:solute carrier family 22 member 4-like [Mercenaria mercenaria]
MSYSSKLEHLIEGLGGCGLMQKLICIIIHSSTIVIVWSVLAMSFIGYDPGFKCHILDVKFSSLSVLNLSEMSTNRLCSVGRNATCSAYAFHDKMNTAVSEYGSICSRQDKIVNQVVGDRISSTSYILYHATSSWNLVCDRRWIVAFITSIQMVGDAVGAIVAGQMADAAGRKPAMLTGITAMVLFNFVGYFTQSWQIYSVVRFFIGVGVGISFTVQFTQMIEFVPSPWRPFVVCFPSEPLSSMLYALVSWWLHDWKRIHLLKTLIGVFILTTLCFVPESFRWLISKKKFEHAERSISSLATVNGVPKPDVKEIFDTAATDINKTSKATTVFAMYTAWYCMSLGMESISVDIYLTIFLINLVDLPAFSVTGPLVNRFGRKKYCFVVCGVSSILMCVSGILQHFDKISRPSMSLAVAALAVSLLAKMTVTTASIALIIYTTEIYPTVVRSIGYGFQSTVGRLGAVAAPLLIHLDGRIPGLMYFTCGVLIFLSAGSIARLKETKGVTLPDSISDTK